VKEIVKGAPLEAGPIRVVPLLRCTRREHAGGPFRFWQWSVEPMGVQVYGDGEPYALDLEGNRSETLLSV
jgi:hypothetical protein